MSLVTASIELPAPAQSVWDLVMDPHQLDRWVTIHRRLIRADSGRARKGFTLDQQIHMRGVTLEVHWELVECKVNELAVWEGRGPARSKAHSEYHLKQENNCTHFDYRNEFHAPLGPLGAIVSRALVGGMPSREAKRTLERLRDTMEEVNGA